MIFTLSFSLVSLSKQNKTKITQQRYHQNCTGDSADSAVQASPLFPPSLTHITKKLKSGCALDLQLGP